MNVETFKLFIHDSLLESFPNDDLFEKALYLANKDYENLVSKIPDKQVVPFDQEVFILKRAIIFVYDNILQGKCELKDITLTGLGISEDQVFDHFNTLRNQENADLQLMRSEVLRLLEGTSSVVKPSRRINFAINRHGGRYGRYR